MREPLISIGVPTYNRPEGLKKTLNHIIVQTYKNIEIIISDNGSDDPLVHTILEDFKIKDARIRHFRQAENKGAAFNFKFVYEKAKSDFFMYAADDDYFESEDLLEKLIEKCKNNILVFSDMNLVNSDDITYSMVGSIYKNCKTKFDYLEAWSRSGAGYPFYGLYNLKRLKAAGINFQFYDDVFYYNEGTFLHKIFINGAVQFIPDVFLRIDNNSSRPSSFKLIKYFNIYCNRTLNIYLKNHVERKLQVISNIFTLYSNHFNQLIIKAKEEHGVMKTLLYIMNKPVLFLFVISITMNKISNRSNLYWKKMVR